VATSSINNELKEWAPHCNFSATRQKIKFIIGHSGKNAGSELGISFARYPPQNITFIKQYRVSRAPRE